MLDTLLALHIRERMSSPTQEYRHTYVMPLKNIGELDEKYGITFHRHIRDLQTIRDLALQNGAYSAAVMAEKAEAWRKAISMLINQKYDTGA